MEHRWSVRKALQQRVVVDCFRFGGGVVTMCDISTGGMLVDSPTLFLPLNAPVLLAFSVDQNGRSSDFMLDAMIVRHTKTGAGLMFSDLSTSTFRALCNALYGWPRPVLKVGDGVARFDDSLLHAPAPDLLPVYSYYE